MREIDVSAFRTDDDFQLQCGDLYCAGNWKRGMRSDRSGNKSHYINTIRLGLALLTMIALASAFLSLLLRLHWHIFTTHFPSASIRHIFFACVYAPHIFSVARSLYFTRIYRVEKLACLLFGTYVSTRKMRGKASIYTPGEISA